MQNEVNQRIQGLAGSGPLAQAKPAYFKEMMTAIGTGTVQGTQGQLTFVSTAPPPPVPTPPTVGTGLKFDNEYFAKQLYSKLRTLGQAVSGKTLHDPYPPGKGNSGEFLQAICEGLGVAIKKHYSEAALLTAPQTGLAPVTISSFSGLVPVSISGLIMGLAPTLKGPFFPQFALAYATVYTITIHTKTQSKSALPWFPTGIVS
jgi:hypothetical protein